MNHRLPISDRKRPVGTVVVTILGILGVLLGFVAWAVSSPVDGSPDDDYHLSTIWCPPHLEGAGCDTQTDGGARESVSVPESVKDSAKCLAFHSDQSASCADTLSDTRDVRTQRFDDGGYPVGYYQFHHLFVGEDVHRSIIVMRLVNILLGLGGIVAVGLLADPRVRHCVLVAAIAAWVPMGVYFIGSNNPSSWAVSGCLIYGAALIAATGTQGKRRGALLALAVYGAVLSATSRGDSAFFMFVISLAVWLLVRFDRPQRPVLVVSLAATIGGLAAFLSTGQAASLTADGGWPTDTSSSIVRIALVNVNSLLDYVATFWGYGYGPGWVDVPLPSWSTLTMIFLAGGVMFVGAEELTARKLLAATVLLGATVGIPLVTMTMRRVHPLTFYQGRYMLPLLAVFFLVWLLRRRRPQPFTSNGQLVLIMGVASVANAFALRRLITRYSTGINGSWTGGLDAPAWWPWALPAKAVLLVGAVAMALGIVALLLVSRGSLKRANALAAPGAFPRVADEAAHVPDDGASPRRPAESAEVLQDRP